MKGQNPILTGFNPDPSIIRVGLNYYIATSTFEWFPGVQIHHSTDLVNWQLITRPLDSIHLLDLKGVPDSCGVWAPCLSHDGEKYHLVYSNVKSFDGIWKDTPNFLITAEDIMGPWSDPIFLASYGFDGSLFHDDDGTKWYLSLLVDQRKGKFFGGIVLQKYDASKKQLTGDLYHIFDGTELGLTEGPHLYKLNGYYYLITAEGGTEYGHAVSIARSKNITGPYEVHPENPLKSASGFAHHPFQKTGHGDLVWTPEEKCYLVFLTGRPLIPHGRCPLGRETAIEEIEWRSDDWPYLTAENGLTRHLLPGLPDKKDDGPYSEFLDFSKHHLSINYQSLRVPMTQDWLKHLPDAGCLRIFGRESLSSTHMQSLIARRAQHFSFQYSAHLQFEPTSSQHLMGLVCYYNTGHYFYLHLYGDKDGKSVWLNVIKCDNFEMTELLLDPLKVNSEIHLRVDWKFDKIGFQYSFDEQNWIDLSISEDVSILSDDYVRDGSDRYRPAFTGSFVGVACQDLTGFGQHGDVYSLSYVEV